MNFPGFETVAYIIPCDYLRQNMTQHADQCKERGKNVQKYGIKSHAEKNK